MSFWEPQYLPSKENLTVDKNHPEHNIQLTNIQSLPNGKYRAYKSKDATRIYLGTFDTIEECLSAQAEYALTGVLPPKQRLRKQMTLTELVALFLEINEA